MPRGTPSRGQSEDGARGVGGGVGRGTTGLGTGRGDDGVPSLPRCHPWDAVPSLCVTGAPAWWHSGTAVSPWGCSPWAPQCGCTPEWGHGDALWGGRWGEPPSFGAMGWVGVNPQLPRGGGLVDTAIHWVPQPYRPPCMDTAIHWGPLILQTPMHGHCHPLGSPDPSDPHAWTLPSIGSPNPTDPHAWTLPSIGVP